MQRKYNTKTGIGIGFKGARKGVGKEKRQEMITTSSTCLALVLGHFWAF